MDEILEFIVSYMAFLWEKANYQIVGSEVTTHNGGDALLLIESANVRLRFACDRRQLFLDFQTRNGSSRSEWYSVDLIRRMFFGNRETSSFLDASYAAFMREHMEEIDRRFSAENWPETRSELRVLRAKRAKETFG
jgi:hypothetical protein